MGKGKATGIDRNYQVLARRIVETLGFDKGLIPYSGDGIDVAIDLGGPTWTFDFALITVVGNGMIVGECKRWASPVKQSDVAAFAYLVELLFGASLIGRYDFLLRRMINA